MAKNITLMGADYPSVPAVVLPQTGGGNAVFVDADEVGNIEEAIAIVVDGDTAPKAITAGQYLFIKNHSTLAAGGYHATANIASGGAVSSNNVAADADGITNAINSKIKSGTVTGSTDSAGNRIINPSPLKVINVVCEGYMCIPFVYSNNSTYVKVLDVSTLQPLTSTSVTINYLYYDA